MDAPRVAKANEGASMASDRDPSPARRRSHSNPNLDEHEQRHQGSGNGSKISEERAEEEERSDEGGDEESDDEDEEPRLKYSYLTKHLGSIYRNGDATSTFLVAGDKMVGAYLEGTSVSSANDVSRLLERTMESL